MTSLFRDDMDWYELRALRLEMEQRQRFQIGGSHREFWSSKYEQMQTFLIERYRSKSESYARTNTVPALQHPALSVPIPRPPMGSDPSFV